MDKRRPDFAGSWYSGNESDCRQTIEELSDSSDPCGSIEGERVGGIVPHAGWFFSGRIACNVIKCLSGDNPVETIVIFGRHLHPGSKNFIMKEGLWATPLGDLEVDNGLAERLIAEFPFTIETVTSYEQDNTIELQLPFIKYFFPDVRILPIGVPPEITSLKVGERVVELANRIDRRISVLGSTDLTHYGDNYGYAPMGVGEKAVDWVKNENDKKVIDMMVMMDAKGVIRESSKNFNACCGGAAATTIAAAKRLGAIKGKKLDYYTSYDIRPNSSFVGYVGIVFHS